MCEYVHWWVRCKPPHNRVISCFDSNSRGHEEHTYDSYISRIYVYDIDLQSGKSREDTLTAYMLVHTHEQETSQQ